ncbi:non-specific serine/threonine protein kinase [Dyadobacter jejuensis]|uniref:Non-specific serine/threonine protein kinase n=1 Tax=Dyadobacter jejuensis TaxID=1082580 RepID=A0A316AGA7_9BACT|nr:SNF2-related protein [Dyadobacter jejuensis]PWJ56651.1 non-specific serine/threonine protein kinase [Dyadobacter jejuensis]
MENEKKEKLSDFLIRRADKDRLSRGRSIYSSGALKVSKLEYLGTGTAEFKIKSDYSIHYFQIQIRDFLTPQIIAECTCNDNSQGLCKHRVASILYILDKMPIIKQIVYEMQDTEVEMADLRDYVLRGLVLDETWKNRDQINNVEVNIAKEGHAECEVVVEEQRFQVNLIRQKGTRVLQTSCSCNQELWVPLCEHKLAALLKIRSELGDRAFEVMRDFSEDKAKLLEEYGYSLEDDFKDKFDFKIDESGDLSIIKLDPSIQKVGKYQDWAELRYQILPYQSDEFEVSNPEGNSEEDDRMTFFSFWPKGVDKLMDFGFGVFSAKYNDKTDKLTTIRTIAGGSSQYYSADEVPVLSEAEARLVRLSRSLEDGLQKFTRKKGWTYNAFLNYDDVTPMQKSDARNYTGKQVQRIFHDLADQKIFITENDNVTNNNQLESISIHRTPAKLFFALTEDSEFVTLRPLVEIVPGSPQNLEEVTSFDSFWLGVYRNKLLYRWAGLSDAEMVHYLRNNGYKIRVRKEHSEDFLTEWVIPVTKQFDVMFQTRHELLKKPLEFEKPQIYLKEDDANLLIVPTYLYKGPEGSEEEILEFHHNQKRTQAGFEDGKITVLERNHSQENEIWKWLKGLNPDFAAQDDDSFLYVPFDQVMKDGWLYQFVEAIQEKGYDLLGFKDLKKMRFNPNRGKVQVTASSGIDWFDMQVLISFGDQIVSMGDAKKALLKKQNFVQLKDGTLGVIPEEWIKKLEPILKFGRVNGNGIHLSKIHFSLIESLIAEIDDEDIANELKEKKQKLLNFKEIPNVVLPPNIKATLRHYQEEGYKWMNFLDEFRWGGCLADDMGLGKTLQILTFIQQQKNLHPTATNLVVVPTTLIFNWQAEAEKFTPELKLYVHRGMTRRKDIDFFTEYDVILTTYGTMRSDVQLLRNLTFHYIILDEAQAIKNPDSLTSKASRLLVANNRLTMTGTPVENNTFDLYAQFEFLNPGMLGNADFFRSEYATPIDKYQDKEKSEELRRLVYPFMLKRTKEEVATDLPDKTETILFCEMGKKQRKVYDHFREKYRAEIAEKLATEGLNKSSFLILEALLKLRQICDSPAILSGDEDHGSESAKLEEIVREIEENASNHKILIFSQFLGMLDLIKTHLEKVHITYEYLDGQTVDRASRVNRFQNDQSCRVFLMSLKAGGVGLNLTEADYVYLVDPWWNPAVERQAIDRTHRIGQQKKVFAYKMICKDTIEEKILLLQQRKQDLAEDLVGGESGFIKKLTQDDIMSLFN